MQHPRQVAKREITKILTGDVTMFDQIPCFG